MLEELIVQYYDEAAKLKKSESTNHKVELYEYEIARMLGFSVEDLKTGFKRFREEARKPENPNDVKTKIFFREISKGTKKKLEKSRKAIEKASEKLISKANAISSKAVELSDREERLFVLQEHYQMLKAELLPEDQKQLVKYNIASAINSDVASILQVVGSGIALSTLAALVLSGFVLHFPASFIETKGLNPAELEIAIQGKIEIATIFMDVCFPASIIALITSATGSILRQIEKVEVKPKSSVNNLLVHQVHQMGQEIKLTRKELKKERKKLIKDAKKESKELIAGVNSLNIMCEGYKQQALVLTNTPLELPSHAEQPYITISQTDTKKSKEHVYIK